MNKKIKKFLYVSFLFILLISCKKNIEDEKAETIFAVETTKVIKGEINDFIELNGDIKAKDEVDVYPDVAGKYISINEVKLGQNVYKDQIIGYVDPSKPGMDYKPSPVRSTISGVITSLPIKNGATVTMQTSIAKVGKIEELEIVTYVSEKFLSKMKLKLPVIIKTQAYPDKKINGFVKELSPVIDPTTRMMEVKISFAEKSDIIKPGMFAEIKIITEKKDDIVKIPEECLIKRYGSYYVFVVHRNNEKDQGSVEQRKVFYGIQIENKIEITEGLNPDDEIVINGQNLLEDKSKVKIINIKQSLTKEDLID